jgi:predicted nucleic acid-binding Zn ribbon protein
MAQHEFTSARTLLPNVLARLAKETGRAQSLGPVWNEVVGPVAARSTTLLWLEGTTLVVETENPRWSSALDEQRAYILARLAERLGEGVVKRIVYRSKTAK